jgi:two-component sensor histidine kinase
MHFRVTAPPTRSPFGLPPAAQKGLGNAKDKGPESIITLPRRLAWLESCLHAGGASMPLRRLIPYLPQGKRSFWKGQAIALVAVLAALSCRTAADPFVDQGLYFTFLFPVVLVAGLFGGTWSAISTAFFGALLIAYIWIPPRYSFNVAGDGLFRLVSFWAVASMVILLTTFVHTVLDILAAAEQRAATTAREMQHRVQNALTLVQAIARQTFRTSENLAGAQDVFSARLAALGRAQALIDEGIDENVTVATLIKTALTPFDTGQFALSGPSLFLPKDVGISFALLLHELATNAIKYGALSSTVGRVEITWQKETPEEGHLIWKEQSGPPVVQPSRIGFGSKLLRAAFPQGRGDASIAFEPDGVRCTISFPIRSDVVEARTASFPDDVQPLDTGQGPSIAG